MKNIKYELFNFRKNLSLEQEEVSVILENHIKAYDSVSEKDIVTSLNERLKPYTFDKEVKTLLEDINNEMSEYKLLYELKHLYKVLDSQNQGELYRQPINVLLQTINLESDQDRMTKVLNELAVYNWVPEIKLFVNNLTTSPEKRSNLLSGGKSESIFTIVEQVDNGYVALVDDSWFLLKDTEIEKTTLESNIQDENKLRLLRTLETALKYAEVSEDRVDFRVSENLTIGLSVSDKGTIFINDDKMNKETTLESLFQSPLIPIINKNFYPLILETSNNLDKFVEFDVVKKVTNMVNPFLEAYAFNYKDSIYVYRSDSRYGKSFYKYSNSEEVVMEMKNELNYDLTYFYEDKLQKDVVKRKKLEDKEREITLKLEDLNLNISKLEGSIQMIGESGVLTTALSNLEKRRDVLNSDLQVIKELKYTDKEKM